jgi:hypothetical protein
VRYCQLQQNLKVANTPPLFDPYNPSMWPQLSSSFECVVVFASRYGSSPTDY